MTYLIMKNSRYWARYKIEQEITAKIKAETPTPAGGGTETPTKIKTAVATKKAELQALLAKNEAKVANSTAITNKTGWETWESENGIKMYIAHLKKDIKWCDDTVPTTL